MQERSIKQRVDSMIGYILKMSRTPANYWGEFALDIPIGIFLIISGLRHFDMHPAAAFATILAGVFLFSFAEYVIHRWVFHGRIQLFVQGHRSHHENPMGYDGLPFFLPALVLLGFLGIAVLMMPEGYAFLLIGTIAFGYTIYGVGHFIIHHVRFHRNLPRHWAANHLIHHYHPEANFGVTTPLWDILFSTRFERP